MPALTQLLRRALVCLMLTAAVLNPAIAGAQDIRVWVYHNFPPFIVDEDRRTGLSYDLAALLTERSDGRYRFIVSVLPRQRLNLKIADDVPGIVLWANPAWFGDAEQTRFGWTAPVLNDRNDVISAAQVQLEYDGPQSLAGQTLVGVEGHRYPGVDSLVDDGVVTRVDVTSEEAVLHFIASARGDVAIIASSAARYYVRAMALDGAVHFSEPVHSQYQRSILVQPQLEPVRDYIDQALAQIRVTEQWRGIADAYGLPPEQLP